MRFLPTMPDLSEGQQIEDNSVEQIHLVVILVTLVLLLVATAVTLMNHIYNSSFLLIGIALLIVSYVFLQAGLTATSKFISVFGMLILTWIFVIQGDGVYDPLFFAGVIAIFLAAILYSPVMSLVVCLLSLGFGVVLVLGTQTGLLPSPENTMISAWGLFGIQAIICVIITVISYFVRLHIDHIFTAFRTAEDELQRQNRRLNSEIQERTKAVEALEQSKEQYRTIVEDQPNFIVRWQPDGTIIFANQSYCDDLNKTKEQVIGANFFSWDLPENVAIIKAKIRSLTPDNPVQVSTHSADRINETVWHRWADRAIFDEQGKLIAIESIGTDVTSEKQLEQKMIQVQVLQDRKTFLEDFFGTMTHDLKTPLSVINTSLYLARKTDDPDKREVYFDRIQKQVKTQEQIINNILSILRLDHMPVETLQPISANELILLTQEKLKSKFTAKQISFATNLAPDLPKIHGMLEQIERLLLNLIENAINYTPQEGSVTVSTERAGDKIIISVSDTGMGIPPDDLDKIFDLFYRARNTENIEGGTGLGLAITRRIVELHDGEITCESTLDQGTTFTVKLPLIDISAMLP